MKNLDSRKLVVAFAVAALLATPGVSANAAAPLVLQSDFGNKDVAVASMKGVAVGVSRDLDIFDLTHEIPAFNIWEASLRLAEVADYWPVGTVFVSVVDPGVGTERKSVVLQTEQGHYYVTPDNGSLTAVAEKYGIAGIREIDEAVNRLADSEKSYTFHGRDVYAYTGARLAAGEISFNEVGRKLPNEIVRIPYQRAAYSEGQVVGNIEVLDPQFGNIWTNIDRSVFAELQATPGDAIRVAISNDDEVIYAAVMPYHRSFGRVAEGEPLLYLNSLNKVSLAVNQGNFSARYNVFSGPSWRIELSKPD
ncbi:MAG: S-adenosyl-l-methionine hydroxide adenosyltransferase family protein [Pseudomonadaceae bacterium]|nr:S-adenosyl-l-methionine hydroxide adenosyltransferase family protein [Pseudomonadaceae bacterium]